METLLLTIKNVVLFPETVLTIQVAREKNKNIIRSSVETIYVVTQRDAKTKDPKPEDIYTTGTKAEILNIEESKGKMKVTLRGLERVYLENIVRTDEGLQATAITTPIDTLEEINQPVKPEIISNILEKSMFLIDLHNDKEHAEIAKTSLRDMAKSPIQLVNFICGNFGFAISMQQELLEMNNSTRADKLSEILNKEAEMQKTQVEINTKTIEDIAADQRAYFLHHQMAAIQRELGEDDGKEIFDDLRKKAETKNWNNEVKAVFEEQLKKLERLNTHHPEFADQQNYLEFMLDLPWNDVSEDNYDIRNAKQVLDEDHYGLEKVKERIIEYLAVMKARKQGKSPILCLYGPPGIGKTSLGKSVARALGRKYARVSLGGLHDEAEIRGHRKTYIGAMPGRILAELKKTKTSNPVFVLDEIDKIGADYKGDPTAALLEVLDPEQNTTFHDNYLDIDYDLSKVLFIATANSLDTIPRPLLDRMELIEMTGYCIEEKQEIAAQHLIPKQLEEHGLKKNQLRFTKKVLALLIDNYTRESGVRSLERQIAAICRKVVTKMALGEEYNVSVTAEDLVTYLGKARFSRDIYEDNRYIGVVTGLAWTQVGGEILFIETSLSHSKTPTLTLTGNLGDVMKESATIALGYIKAHAADFGISPKDLETTAVHIHVPEGAIPKDGPSAGITMTTALVSAFTKRKVRARIAMTGEMTLRGKVLPIGGVKEKMLAAKRAGITDLIFCKDNEKDVLEIPELYRKGLTFHYVSDIHEVIALALL